MLAVYAGIPVIVLLTGLGVRILLRARADRAATDALVGVYFLCVGVGGAPALLASDPVLFGPSTARVAMAFGHAALSLGFSALLLFVWRCFGVGSRARMWAAVSGCTALAVLFVLQAVVERFEAPGGAVVRATALIRGAALAWSFAESLRYWRLMGRRARLGLGDPVVTNRFLLWCLWMGAMLAASAIAITVRFAMPGFGTEASPLVRVAVVIPFTLLCLVAGGSLWLAFFAPARYTRWIAAEPETLSA